ncbi:tRNA pseudouridine(13) synthase TruD [Phycisphaerales bacterium AB-hyl4]|uniref:tRNA pseudouridine synthase D n=1 Tax=Natronomicrosphaera hydrolytica TaxID=3242702 RepID=A0ABV4U2Z9_9BACT
MNPIHDLAYLTPDLPGVGGRIKLRPDDFLVEEQPLYEPTGEGEHLYLFIEKRQIATTDVVRQLVKAFRVSRRDVGFAGMKDKHAISRQHFSVRMTDAEASQDEALESLSRDDRVTLLWADRHGNKLRRGHLAGNRFVIRIREIEPTRDTLIAKRVLDRLAAAGVPNYLGEQRFGYRQNNHEVGRLLLLGEHQAVLDAMLGKPEAYESEAVQLGRAAYDRGDYAEALAHWPKHLRFDRQALDALRQGRSAEKAVAAIDRNQRAFLITALQSAAFNRVLHERLSGGTFDRLLPGDLAWKHDSRAVFSVDEATAELENGPTGRVPQMAVSPSGPMWGPDMTQAEGEPGRMEREALALFGLSEADLQGHRLAAVEGARRPLRIPLRDPDLSGGVDEHGSYIRLAFELPRGAFATVVLREIMKQNVADDDDDDTA